MLKIFILMLLLPASSRASNAAVAVSTIPVVPPGSNPAAVVSTVPAPGAASGTSSRLAADTAAAKAATEAAAAKASPRTAATPPGDIRPQPDLNLEPLELDKAIEEVSRDTGAAVVLYNAVREIYIRQGKTRKAISLLATYDRNRGTDPSLLNSLANLYEQAGAQDLALKVHERVAALDPDNARNRPVLAELYMRQGDYKKARSTLEAMSKAYPDNVTLLRQMSVIQRGLNDWKAEETVKKVIRLDPQCSDYQLLADLYFQEKKYDEAARTLEAGMAKVPNGDQCLGPTLSSVYFQQGNKSGASVLLTGLLLKAKDPVIKADIQIRLKALSDLGPAALPPASTGYLNVPTPKAAPPSAPAAVR